MKTAPPTHKEPHAMKQIICGAFALLALAATAHAEPQIPEGIFLKAQTADEYLAKDHLIGMKVKGPDGKIIGDIEDLIISDGNQVVGIVMGTGGFLGLGEKRVGVALQSLKFEENGGQIYVVLAAVPAYERAQPKKSLLERAKEKARELSDKTAATTKDAVERAKPALDEAKQKAQEAYEKAKEAVAPTIEKAKEAVQEAVDAAKDAAKPDAPAPNGATTPPAAEPAPAPAAPTTP
jgi:hypothetical protein